MSERDTVAALPITEAGRWLLDHQGLVNIGKIDGSMRGDEIDLRAAIVTIEREAAGVRVAPSPDAAPDFGLQEFTRGVGNRGAPSPTEDRLAMYQEMYLTVAAKWAAVLDAADKAEDVQPDEVIEALRGQPARRCTKVYLHEHDETCRWVAPSPDAPPLWEADIDWLRKRFGNVPPESGHPQDGTLEGVIARLLAALDAKP